MALIEKNGTVYTVEDTVKYWEVKTRYHKCTFTFNIPKSQCVDIEELKKYVKSNFMFG